jgi:hypothetical protein
MFLLADSETMDATERLRGINQYLNRSGGDPWYSLIYWLLAMGAVSVVLIVALRYLRWQRRHQRLGQPWRLFHRVLRAVHLTWSQRRYLARIAGKVCPDTPAAILLARSSLAESVRRWSAGRPAADRAAMANRLAPVYEKLFRPK